MSSQAWEVLLSSQSIKLPLRYTVGWALSTLHMVWLLAGPIHLFGGGSNHCCFCFLIILISAYSYAMFCPDLEDWNKTLARFYNSWQQNKCTYISLEVHMCLCIYIDLFYPEFNFSYFFVLRKLHEQSSSVSSRQFEIVMNLFHPLVVLQGHVCFV